MADDFLLKCRIIELIEQHPLIYDKQNPRHFNRDSRVEVYNNIAAETGLTPLEVEKKWKDLLDTYRKKTKSGDPGEPINERAAQWKFFDKMSFMRPYIRSRRTTTNSAPAAALGAPPPGPPPPPAPGAVGVVAVNDAEPQAAVEEGDGTQAVEGAEGGKELGPVKKPESRSTKRKKETDEVQMKILNMLEQESQNASNNLVEMNPSGQDELDFALFSIARRMRKYLDDDQREACLTEVQNVVSNHIRNVMRPPKAPLVQYHNRSMGNAMQMQPPVPAPPPLMPQPGPSGLQNQDVNGLGAPNAMQQQQFEYHYEDNNAYLNL